MKKLILSSCLLFLIMLTTYARQETNESANTITLNPDNTIIKNESIYKKEGPILKDVIKKIDISKGSIFSVNLSVTNLDSYIRITHFTPDLEFINFTRELSRAFISFKALEEGAARLEFQIDNETNILQRHYYDINITNITEKTNDPDMPELAIMPVPIKPTAPILPPANQREPLRTKAETNNQASANIITMQTNTNLMMQGEDQNLYQIANELYKSKSYKEARNEYEALLAKYPLSPYAENAMKDMASIYAAEKNYSAAFSEYKKINDSQTANVTNKAFALYSMGLMTVQMKEDEKSLSYFLQVIKTYPETTQALDSSYMYAYILDKAGRGKEGLSVLISAAEKNIEFPKRQDAIMLLALIYEKTRKYEEAYAAYEKYLREYPKGRFTRDAKNKMNFVRRNFIEIQ